MNDLNKSILIALLAALTFKTCWASSQHNRLGIAVVKKGVVEFSVNGTRRFPFCSTGKVIIVADILHQSQQHPGLLKKMFAYTTSTMMQSGYAPITFKAKDLTMSVAKLCQAAIEYSDNAAANMLIQELGGPRAVTQFARSIGDPSFRLDRYEPKLNSAIPGDLRDITTPISMAKTLDKLAFGHVLGNKQKQLLIHWLVNSKTGAKRIRAVVPKTWRAGDKTGTGDYSSTNDIAII